jgi:hypothetical protein
MRKEDAVMTHTLYIYDCCTCSAWEAYLDFYLACLAGYLL